MAPTPQPTMTREQQQALARARARARISTAKRSIEPIKPSPWSVSQSSYDEMAASPQRSVVGEAPQWATEAPLMGGRTIQDEGREALQSAGTKFRVNTSGTQLDNRHNADGPDLAGGIGDLLKAGNFAVRDWWKNSSYKDKENLIASIPIEATGAGAIARLSDHIGQKTGNDFLKDKTGNFTTDASYDPVAELEMYLINAGTWDTRNAAGGAINPRAQAAKIGPQLPAMRQALAKPTLAEFATPAADVATNATMGLSDIGAAGVRGVAGLVDGLRPKPGAAVPQPTPVATVASPQSAPVAQAPIPQAAPRPAQAGPSSAGQGTAAAQPVLNATPVSAPISRVPADTQKILTRILKAASVPGNDIDGLSLALVQAYEAFKRSGSEFAPRVSLGRFIDQNLAEVAAKAGINLPDVTVRDVQQGLRGRGRTAHGDGDPGDRSRAIMSGTIGDLRTTQKDFARKQIEASDAFNVTAIADQKKALERNAEAIGKEAYNPTLKFAKNVWDGVEAAKPGEKEALQKLQQYLLRKPYLDAIPADLKLRLALDEIPLEKRIAQDPAGTAHWLQSKLGQAAADSTDGGMRGALGDARERLLTELDKAIPAYKNIRADYGDEFRTIKMLDAGKTFFADTLRPADTADLADLYKSGTARQKTAMRMSVRDELFTVFDGTPEDVALRLEKLTSEGRLRGLEEIFGAPGKKVADTLRFIRDESLWLRGDGARGLQGVDALSGSNTVPNALSRLNDAKAVRTGFQGAISSMADRSRIWAAMLADAALALGTGGAYHYPMMTIGAGGSKIARGLGNPSRKVMANSTEGLFGLPKQPANALASLEPIPKPTRKARAPKPDLPTTMRELQEAYQNAPTRAERARIQKQMARVGTAETPNALATPSRPPVKAGFGSSKPLDMSEAGRMQRAREQGFDVETPLYHGTAGDVEAFDFEDIANMDFDTGSGVFLTRSPSEAGYFTKTQTDSMGSRSNEYVENANIMPVYARLRNPVVFETQADFRAAVADTSYDRRGHGYGFKRDMEALGHDGVIVRNSQMDGQDGAEWRIIFDPKNIRGKFAKFDPSQSGSSKLLAGMGAAPEGVGAAAGGIGGGIYGATAPLEDANKDGVIDASDRQAMIAQYGVGGAFSGGVGVKAVRSGAGAVRNAMIPQARAPELPPLTLPKENRVFAPGKPDDLGFITSAEYVLANPIARFKDAKNLTPEQWRKFMREGGASAEAFKFQIEPALKRLADEGYTGDIPKVKLEEALARTRGTLGTPDEMRVFKRQNGREVDIPTETDYGQYVAPGSHTGYKQHVLVLPKEQGQGYKSHNWKSENPVGHVRTTNRTSANGEKVLHVEELQSDLHQEGAKFGYKGEKRVDMNQARADAARAHDRFLAWAEQNPSARVKMADVQDVRALVADGEYKDAGSWVIDDPAGKELHREFLFAKRKVIDGEVGNSNQPPKAPLENWEEPFIRYALKQGADQGVDVITFPSSKTLHASLQNEGTAKFYDERLPRHLESVAKSLGLSVERVELPRASQYSVSKLHDHGSGMWGIAKENGGWLRDPSGAFNVKEFRSKADAEAFAQSLNDRWMAPAIRLTPQAKQRLSQGIIMDAKDPGRMASPPPPKPTQAGFLPSGSGKPGAKPPANALAGPPKPKPVEARREAPRGTKSFSDPRLSPGENKTAEMVLNGYTYDEIADEAMTSVDVIKRQAMLAQRKLGDDVKLPRPGMGKRPPGSTKRDAANSLFGEGLDNATIAQRTGLSIGNVRTYRSYWKEQNNAPVASVEGAAYNPPAMPERPFEADYPQKDWPEGVPTDAQGRLLFDMEGRPLDQSSVIIGRNKAPGVGPQSEADRPLRNRSAIIQTIKQTGSTLEIGPRPASQASGGWAPDFSDNGRFTGRGRATVADDLDRPIMGLDDQEVITLSHELSHIIDFKAKPAKTVESFNSRSWGIDHKAVDRPKVMTQLERIYQDLNNPVDGEIKIRSPKDQGYDSVDADRELWAEAIRAYMYDPNYIKTVAPDVAFLIRHHVNGNSSLRKTIQFNAVPTIAAMGGLGLGAAALNGQPAEAQTRPGGLRANALASQYGERPGR